MIIWLTEGNLEKYKLQKFLHFKLVDREGRNFYTHLGDWELIKKFKEKKRDHTCVIFQKCLIRKRVEEDE